MLAWVAIDRTHSRQTPLSFFPCSRSRFGSHPSLIPEKITPFFSRTYVQPILQPVCFQIHPFNGDMPPFPPCLFTLLHRSIESQVTKSPVVHPLYAQQLTKCSSRNSFILKTIHFDGGVWGTFRSPNVSTFQCSKAPTIPQSIPSLFILLRTPLHFFAVAQNSTRFFSSDSAFCVKKHNHRGWGKGYVSDPPVLAMFWQIQAGQSGQLSPLHGTPATSQQSRVTDQLSTFARSPSICTRLQEC